MRRFIICLFILLFGLVGTVRMEGMHPVCCENVSGNCRAACLKITLIDLATKPERHKLFTAHLEEHCDGTKYLRDFMQCFNNTTRELQRGSNWPGRECCVYARDPRCRVACIYAQSVHELEPVCFSAKEFGLYNCFQSREDAAKCCSFGRERSNSSGGGGSGNGGGVCHNFCLDLLPASVTPPEFSYGDLILLHPKCRDASEVVHCAWGLGKAPDYPLECSTCCNVSTVPACREVCKEVVHRDLTGVPAIEMLISSGCGPPDANEAFWICLLKTLDSEKSTAFIASKVTPNPDTMKLHCCARANSTLCRKACFQKFDSTMTESSDFDDLFYDCLEEPTESGLSSCLRDVLTPCRTSRPNLNFCWHFNDRSDVSFRACDSRSDNLAYRKFSQWQTDGKMILPNGTWSPLKLNGQCSQVWREILCARFLEPCDTANWERMPCQSDCAKMISPCLFTASIETANIICGTLFPSGPTTGPGNFSNCLPLSQSATTFTNLLVLPIEPSTSTPCQPNPCPPNLRCEVRRLAEKFANQTFECMRGCVVSGESSGGVHVFAPEDKVIVPYQGAGEDERVCYKVCTCTADELMTSCEDIGLCDLPEGCASSTQYYEHGLSFQRSCSRCVCMAGELICSAGYCLTEAQRDEERNALTGLPCSCPTDFNRVCGLNGKTYPTECSARCSGLTEYTFKGGICSLEHVCPYNDCGVDKWCVERSEVCLDHQNPCQQHSCVDIKTDCAAQPKETVCDTKGDEHSNMCTLLLAGRRFQYMGKCLNGCSEQGQVCGQNSETFASECAALADRVGVDYLGRCITVGGRVEKGLLNTCLVVEKKCPPRALANCVNVVPPDACCSVCAGALRVLFSKKRLQRLTQRNMMTITSRELITELQKLVESQFCQVLGYLTMENDIVVLVKRLNISRETATLEELNACVEEAERLNYLINSQHPLITVNARLWPLVSSRIIHTYLTKSCADLTIAMIVCAQKMALILFFILIVYFDIFVTFI